MASVAEIFIDHPPLQVVGIKMQTTFKKSAEYGDKHIIACQTPFGKLESQVDPVVYQAAERLKVEEGVLLSVVPRQELIKGQYNKGGFFFQLDIVDVTTVPSGFGKPIKPAPLGGSKL